MAFASLKEKEKERMKEQNGEGGWPGLFMLHSGSGDSPSSSGSNDMVSWRYVRMKES